MHSPLVTGIILSVIWVGIRFGLGQFLPPETAMKGGIMTNIFFILMSIFLVFYFSKKRQNFERVSFLEDLKISLKGGIVYVVIISVSIYGYYSLDTSLYDHKLEEFETRLSNTSKEQILLEKNNNPETKDMTSDEFIRKSRENTAAMASPGTQTIFSTLALTVWCLMASLLCTYVFRKVLLKQ